LLVVGDSRGPPLTNVLTATVAEDGSILVLEGYGAITRFSLDGAVLNDIGRVGEGPGELLNPRSLQVFGDSVFVLDAGNFRVNAFSLEGELLYERRFATPFVVDQGIRLSSGSWWIRGQDRFSHRRASPIKRDTVDYYLLGADFENPREVAAIPGVIGTRLNIDGQVSSRTAPFTPRAHADGRGAELFLSAGSDPVVLVFDEGGDTAAVGHFASETRALTREDREFFVRRVVASNPDPAARENIQRIARSVLIYPDSLPHTQSLLVDPAGFAWLQRFETAVSGNTYHVLSPALQDLGQVVAPFSMILVEVGIDYFLGVALDPETDEESVRMYALTRSEACGGS
jgi:hypothetical protein